jgi:xylulokinase
VAVQRDMIIAADFGTSGVKVGLMGRDLSVIAEVFRETPVHYGKDGAVEQNPEDWWEGFKSALAQLRRKQPSKLARAAALVMSAQMCGVVAVDERGAPLRPCMIWLDKRSAALIRHTMNGFPKVAGYGFGKLLGSVWLTNGAPSLNGMDPPGKMMWLRMNEPEIWARAHKLLDVKDWLIHRACGKFVTTADSANLTWMMDSRSGKQGWSPFLMRRFGLSEDRLPEIVPGTSSPGGLMRAPAAELGLPEGLPVVAGSGDVGAAALGSGAIEDGALHLSLGTSSWIGGFYSGRRLSATESFATITSAVDNRPLLIATQETAGACLEWLSSSMGKNVDVEQERRAEDPPLFLPWLAGERVPVDDNRLRGAFLGLSLRHSSSSLRQAVLEGVALNTRWAYRSVMKKRGTIRHQRMPVVGGAALDSELCQTLADCLGAELAVGPYPRMAGMQGTGAIAAAYLGWYANAWAAAACLPRADARIYVPDPNRARYFDRRFDLFLKAHHHTKPWFHAAHGTDLSAA